MRRFQILLLLLLFSLSVSAQNGNIAAGKISGRIIDTLSGEPIEYATITLLTQAENKVVNGTTSNNKGVFKLTNISEGTYKMHIDFIGYKSCDENNIIVSKIKPNVVLGDIKLTNKQTELKSVSVVAQKSLIENKIDKMVYNADQDISSQSGVAADVLKKVPQVSVDVDGNVELQGNTNIRFLIDGKPSVLFGSNIVDVLQSIPASQIQSIEIITSPGVKYDAQGTGGIINIILKKNNAHGINGSISLSGGTRLENGSVNLNARKGKFGVNAYFSGNAQLLSTTINNMDRSSTDSSSTSRLLQTGKSDFTRHGFESGLGFDWDITKKDNINGTFGYDYFGNSNAGSANRESILKDANGNTISDLNDVINTSNKSHEYAYDFDLGYTKKFKKEDQELEILFNSSNGNLYSYYDQLQIHVPSDTAFDGSNGKNPGIENETNFEVNYTQPLGEDAVFETGAKMVLDHINSVSNVYQLNTESDNFIYDTSKSSSMDGRRTVSGAYLSFTSKLFDWLGIKAGLRDEYTDENVVFSNSGHVNLTPYNIIVPSVVLSHKFKNKQLLKISYTHRIERPEYDDMNPFFNAADPKNITTGNPHLRPEIGDKIEFGYNQTFKNGLTITPTLFYRGNKDDIQWYVNYYPTYTIGDSTYNNVAISIRENIGREDNYGLSLFASIPATKKISLRANINCFQRYIYTGMASGGDIHGFAYRTNMNVAYQLNNSLIIEMTGNFNSRKINAQGTMPATTTYSFAFRKQLFHKKGSIAITATNFFDKYISQKTKLTGENFTISNTRQLPYRSFGINFTYKFGKMEFKEVEDINLTSPPGN